MDADAWMNLHWAGREVNGFGGQERWGNDEDNERVQHDERMLVRTRNGNRLIAKRVVREPGMGRPAVAKFQPVLDERNNQFEVNFRQMFAYLCRHSDDVNKLVTN